MNLTNRRIRAGTPALWRTPCRLRSAIPDGSVWRKTSCAHWRPHGTEQKHDVYRGAARLQPPSARVPQRMAIDPPAALLVEYLALQRPKTFAAAGRPPPALDSVPRARLPGFPFRHRFMCISSRPGIGIGSA